MGVGGRGLGSVINSKIPPPTSQILNYQSLNFSVIEHLERMLH